MSYDSGHYNRGGMYALMGSMVFTMVFFIYLSFFHPGVDLKEIAEDGSAPQQVLAQQDENVDISGEKEPWKSSTSMVSRGKQVYKQYCLMCHGAEGKGDGMAAATLKPPPRNLVKGEWQQGGSQVGLFKVLRDGIPGTSMAAWPSIPEADRWALVHFIQSITQNKVDKPQELTDFLASKK